MRKIRGGTVESEPGTVEAGRRSSREWASEGEAKAAYAALSQDGRPPLRAQDVTASGL